MISYKTRAYIALVMGLLVSFPAVGFHVCWTRILYLYVIGGAQNLDRESHLFFVGTITLPFAIFHLAAILMSCAHLFKDFSTKKKILYYLLVIVLSITVTWLSPKLIHSSRFL